MNISNLVKGYFSNIIAKNPRLLNANRLIGYKVGESPLVKIVEYKEDEREGKPQWNKKREEYENKAQQYRGHYKYTNKFYNSLLQEWLTTPQDRQTATKQDYKTKYLKMSSILNVYSVSFLH